MSATTDALLRVVETARPTTWLAYVNCVSVSKVPPVENKRRDAKKDRNDLRVLGCDNIMTAAELVRN